VAGDDITGVVELLCEPVLQQDVLVVGTDD
jgi:hypothetical protein